MEIDLDEAKAKILVEKGNDKKKTFDNLRKLHKQEFDADEVYKAVISFLI